MTFDDELRARMQGTPSPEIPIDVDAVRRAAKRTRRPKVAGFAAAAVAASALVIVPVTVAGLGSIAPTSISSEDGAPVDAPAAPERTSESSSPAAPSEATARAACLPETAASVGLGIAFLDDPSDGVSSIELTNRSNAPVTLTLVAAGVGLVDSVDVLVAAAPIPDEPDSDMAAPRIVELPPGATTTIHDVPLEQATEPCAVTPPGDHPVPTDGARAAPLVLVTPAPGTEPRLVLGDVWHEPVR